MKQKNKVDATDIIYFPATYLLSYFISKWVPGVLAVPIAVMSILGIGYFVSRARGSDMKNFFLAVLVSGTLTFLLGLVGWPV